MSKVEEAKTYSRAFECQILPDAPVDVESFVKRAKIDWDLRGQHDPARYVCAHPGASEEEIRASGTGDVVREFLPRVLDYPHDSVLEIGCGFGRMTRAIAEYASRGVVGIDISPSLISLAKIRLADVMNATVMEGDGITLNGVPDDAFDVAFEYTVFQHIPAEEVIRSYIREVYKKLKNYGVFVMHGRDVPASDTGLSPGNTWHGCRIGRELVMGGIGGTQLHLIKDEGVGTDRYWATLQKRRREV
jgi:SAM-dependent methyltransferase